MALDVGQCASVDDMTGLLKAEGQQSVAFGTAKEEVAGKARDTVMTVILSADSGGQRGYVLQTDLQLGKGATVMCVRNRLARVRLYDVQKPGTPPEVFVKASSEAAERRCRSLITGGGAPEGCGLLNEILVQQEKIGGRVLMQAMNQRKQKDGSYASDDVLVTVFLNLTAKDSPTRYETGGIDYTTPEGATIVSRVFINTQITENGRRMVKAMDKR
jgi:hypothetical protein